MQNATFKTRLLPAAIALVLIAGCGAEGGTPASPAAGMPNNSSTEPSSTPPSTTQPSTSTSDSAQTQPSTPATESLTPPAASASTSSAYSGTGAALPNILQAEDFDRGGESVAYHDTTAGNSGGQYRTGEAVDIVKTTGGYAINNFRTGEWLAYTVKVPATGAYNFDLNASSTTSTGAFHIEIDGQNLTGKVALANTGNLNTFKWWGLKSLNLTAGTHKVKVVVDQESFNLDAIRFSAAAAATPYLGAPVSLPSTFEAENYDNGGEGVAFHDLSAGNSGGQYRPGEAVDIIGSGNASGGFAITNFQTGEWVAYSVNVAKAGNYTFQLHEATTAANAAFHVEIDGQNVTGSLGMPNTGSTSTYRWTAMQAVTLTAGKHQVKIVSEQEFFNLDSVIFAPAANPLATSNAKLLFSTGFEGSTLTLPPILPLDCWGMGCWANLVGQDTVTNFTLPSTLGNGTTRFLLLSDPVPTTSANVEDYLFSHFEAVAGHNGATTRAVRQQISKNLTGTAPMGSQSLQNEFQFLPKNTLNDLYVSYWLKVQPDLVQKMNNLPAGPGVDRGGTWRGIFAFKTGSLKPDGWPANDGDYRVEAYINTYGGGAPYWCILGDNNAGSSAPETRYWTVDNHDVPVPIGQWFKLEIYWHRSSGSDGRVWMGVNGQTIADHRGPNMGVRNLPINRIMAPMLYTGQTMPAYQWVDDLEIWDGFPAAGSNPPYAAH